MSRKNNLKAFLYFTKTKKIRYERVKNKNVKFIYLILPC